MRVLMACAGGMSSAFVADGIEAEAKKNGVNDFEIKAIGDSRLKEELGKSEWDIIVLAPQVKFQTEKIKLLADEQNIPVYNIEGRLYTIMGAPTIFEDIRTILKK